MTIQTSRIYKHKIIQVDDDTMLWRYMDLPRFLDLLLRKSFFFSRADRFKDPFEGAIPKKLYERMKSRVERTSGTREEREKNQADFVSFCQNLKARFYVNCWHLSKHQSEAMWRLYAPSGDAIAVTTRFKNMCEAMPPFVSFAPVHYGDHDFDDHKVNNFPEYILAILLKRKSFEYEKEARFFFENHELNNAFNLYTMLESTRDGTGFNVKVDLHNIIEHIYISPFAKDWFAAVVKEVTQIFGYKFEVSPSDLLKPPDYIL